MLKVRKSVGWQVWVNRLFPNKKSKMPYALFECTTQDQNSMEKIWDSVWSALDIEQHLRKIEVDTLSPIFFRHLPKHGKVLEAGCGLGQWVVYLKKNGYDILGLDFAQQTIDVVKRYDSTIPVESGDITHTKFSDNYFSAYISLGVLEHFIDGPTIALMEAHRIVEGGGLLLISIPVFNSIRKVTTHFEKIYNYIRENKYIRKLLGKEFYPPKYFVEYRYTIKEFEKKLTDQGFSVIAKYTIDHSPFGMFNYFLEPPKFLLKGQPFYRICDCLSIFLMKRSEWIAPHQVIWICTNNKSHNSYVKN